MHYTTNIWNKSLWKAIEIVWIFKDNINNNDFIFLQETHSLSNDEPQWKDDFGILNFFHTEKAILVVWQPAIVEQKLLKWQTQHATKVVHSNSQCRIE